MRMTNLVISSSLVLLILLGVAGSIYARQSLRWESLPMTTAVTDDTVYLPSNEALRMMSLGYGPFASDLMFIRAHAYLLRHMSGDRILQWLDRYVDAVVALDENNQEIYNWAATVVRYGQIIDEDVIERSNHFAEMGLERFPDDSRLYSHLGYNKYYELRPTYLEQERGLRDLAAKAPTEADRQVLLEKLAAVRGKRYKVEREALVDYTLSAMLPGSHVDPVFLLTLYVKHDEAAAAGMAANLHGMANEGDQWQLEQRLRQLGHKDLAERLRLAAASHKKELPYVPEGLFQLMGSKRDLRVPKAWDRMNEIYGAGLKVIEQREAQL